jgi:ankyrin repeat protein
MSPSFQKSIEILGEQMALAIGEKDPVQIEEVLKSGYEPSANEYGELMELSLEMKATSLSLWLVEKMAAHGVPLDKRKDKLGKTFLHLALEKKQSEVAIALLTRGASVDARDHTWATPLHYTVRFLPDLVPTLFALVHPDIHAVDVLDDTPLHWAACRGEAKAAEELLKRGANVNLRNQLGNTVVHCAIYNAPDLALTLLERAELDINAVDYNRNTLLHVAVKEGYEAIALALVKRGANLEAGPGEESLLFLSIGRSMVSVSKEMLKRSSPQALSWQISLAMKRKDFVKVERVLQLGYEPSFDECNRLLYLSLKEVSTPLSLLLVHQMAAQGMSLDTYRDNLEKTFLHLALERQMREVVEALLTSGANVNIRDLHGFTPLHLTIWDLPSFLPTFLTLADPDLDAADDSGEPPLHWALNAKDRSAVLELLRRGASTTLQNGSGDTFLHSAIQDKPDFALILLEELTFDSNVVDDRGNTLLHKALQERNEKIAVVLMRKGASLKAKNHKGETPLSLSIECRMTSITKVIVARLSASVALHARERAVVLRLHAAILSMNEREMNECVSQLESDDLRHPNFAGCTPLVSAVQNGYVSALCALIQKLRPNPATPADADEEQWAEALQVATIKGDIESAKKLIEVATLKELLRPNARGQNAFHLAILFQRAELCERLRAREPEYWYKEDSEGCTPETYLILIKRKAEESAAAQPEEA